MSKIKGMDKAQKRLRDMDKKFTKVAEDAMGWAVTEVWGKAGDNVTNAGPVLLNRKSGVLHANIRGSVGRKGSDVVGTVGIPQNVWYGRLHELGLGRAKRRPWLSLAYKVNKKKIDKRFERITKDLLKATK